MDFAEKLQVFITVAELQSFARAAQSLGLARPSVTVAINELEKEVGARLLHRTTRRTTLTSEGVAYYEQATMTLNAVGEARNFFGGGLSEPKGRLRVDMSNSLAKSMIIPNISSFKKAYPQVEVILGVSDQQVDLIAEGVDCVLRIGESSPTSLVSRTIYRDPFIICASPDYLKTHGAPKSLDDLKNHLGVVYFYGRERKVKEWMFTVNGKPRSIRMRPALQVNNHDAYVACALNGLGLAQIPLIGVRNELAAGSLVQVLADEDAGHTPISVMYPARKYLPMKVRVFIDWVISIFEKEEAKTLKSPEGASL
ncbi:LysR family transcriptional regulator [Pseudomonas kurunegalensis]|uniref:LysR family transcriptional regulator n=1 Tax=Pseudomonas kurunegalensis TaxID=485880 RepID=UPI002570FAF6|nr:LysR family transcriptional regulator [Pseudomonas kurunegalensis]WJD60711.1 LysR family transcriptional regulator [Pseudomonas kurunegalensis]